MRVIRILVYEGTPDNLREQLGNSMNDGTRRYPRGSITAVTLTGGWRLKLRTLWSLFWTGRV